jgi:hypothetical protein
MVRKEVEDEDNAVVNRDVNEQSVQVEMLRVLMRVIPQILEKWPSCHQRDKSFKEDEQKTLQVVHFIRCKVDIGFYCFWSN